MNISDVNQPIIPYYSPISAKGGRRHRKLSRTHSKNGRTRKHKRTNKSRTKRRYHS
jgi:hypothetical protein